MTPCVRVLFGGFCSTGCGVVSFRLRGRSLIGSCFGRDDCFYGFVFAFLDLENGPLALRRPQSPLNVIAIPSSLRQSSAGTRRL